MLSRINIEKKLLEQRFRRVEEQELMKEVFRIFSENEEDRKAIISKLGNSSTSESNSFNFNLLETSHIFHLEDIKNICTIYRLRFLDSKFFKGGIPEEAISKIRNLESIHHTSLKNFKIVAPAKLLKLENADDPLLFAPMGNDYYYLIHKWGRDLHPLRKWLMWPYKNFENLVFTVFLFSILLTALIPMSWFTAQAGTQEYIFLFLILFKMVGGVVLFYGFAKGKNFNGAIWNSKFYNG